jgi:hypothetical protein
VTVKTEREHDFLKWVFLNPPGIPRASPVYPLFSVHYIKFKKKFLKRLKKRLKKD